MESKGDYIWSIKTYGYAAIYVWIPSCWYSDVHVRHNVDFRCRRALIPNEFNDAHKITSNHLMLKASQVWWHPIYSAVACIRIKPCAIVFGEMISSILKKVCHVQNTQSNRFYKTCEITRYLMRCLISHALFLFPLTSVRRPPIHIRPLLKTSFWPKRWFPNTAAGR